MGSDRAASATGVRTWLPTGMMWIARTGAQWRHLPGEYGKWDSVFRRYRRWVTTGVFDAMLETLAEMPGPT